MSDNTLFNYLSDPASAPVVDFIEHVIREEKTNRFGVKYFLLEIKKHSDELIKGFTVINHHISIYEHGDEYHYTAELTDVDGDQFRLHVYFNHKSEVTKSPFFEIKNDQGEYIRYVAEQYDKLFIKLAKDTTQPILAQLKSGIKRHIQTLETAYTTLEANACDLSRNISENYEAYITKLDAAYQATLAILPFADETTFYSARANRLEKLKRAFEHQHAIETQARAFETQKSEDDEQSQTSAEPINVISQAEQTVVPIYLDAEINELAERFKQLSEKTDAVEQAKELADIRAKTVGFFLRLDSSTTLASLASLALLQKLDSDTAVKGCDLYNRLLITRNVDGLIYLTNFHHLIEDKHLVYALVKKDDKFLNFVIECGHFDANDPVTVRDINYPSAARYCLDTHTDEAPMAGCLSVLLNQGASCRGLSFFAGQEAAIKGRLGRDFDLSILNEDPVIVQERERMTKAIDKLTKILKPQEARAYRFNSRDILQRRYSALKEKSYQGMDYSRIRRGVITELVEHTEEYERAYELLMLRKEIEKHPVIAKSGKPNGNQQRLFNRAAQLCEEEKAFNRKYYPSGKDVEKEDKNMVDMMMV